MYNMTRLKLYYQPDTTSTQSQSDSLPSASAQSASQPSTSAQSDTQPSSSILLTSCNCRRRCKAKKSCPCRQTSEECHPGHSSTSCDKELDVIDTSNYMPAAKRQYIPKPWLKVAGITLHEEVRDMISSSGWLDDDVITACQNLLHEQYPAVGGLQPTALSQKFAMGPPTGDFVQVLNVSGSHWIIISTMVSISFGEGLWQYAHEAVFSNQEANWRYNDDQR